MAAFVGDRVDSGKFSPQRLHSQRFEPGLVHEALIQIGDFPDLGVGIAGLRRLGLSVNETVDDPAQLLLSRVIHVGERPIGKPCRAAAESCPAICRSSTDIDRPGDEPSDPHS